VKHGI